MEILLREIEMTQQWIRRCQNCDRQFISTNNEVLCDRCQEPTTQQKPTKPRTNNENS